MELRAGAQRRVGGAQSGQLANRHVERVVLVEVVVGRRRRRADEIVVVVVGHERREHVLAGILVAAGAGEPLLVAVVDDGHAARGQVQRLHQDGAGQPVGVAGAAVLVDDDAADAADVVVAHELGQPVGVGVGVGEPVVLGEEVGQPVGRVPLRHNALHRAVEAEVEHRGERQFGGEAAQVGRVAGVDLAEDDEVGVALALGVGAHGGHECLPELVVDVLDRVDAEAVDAEFGDHRVVGGDHAVHDVGVLGEQVIQPDEVAVQAVLAAEVRVAPVVVVDGVVEPRGGLDVLIARRDLRHVGEADLRVEVGEVARAGVVAVVELVAGGVLVGHVGLADVTGFPADVLDDVAGVVDDDVEVDLDAQVVGGVDQVDHVLVRAQVRVDLRQVDLPVAVVGRGRVVGRGHLPLHPAVGERRGDPQRGDAQIVEVGQLVHQAGQVAAVVEALLLGPVAVDVGAFGGVDAAGVIGRIAVGEAVGHDEVDELVGPRLAQRRGHQ